MWSYYGKILAEYVFIKRIRSSNTNSFLRLEGQEILDKIKSSNEPVIFISGHFDNFELMAMQIEKSGIDLAAIYRPLNNQFLNPLMENIRKKYICKKQIKKGISGTKEILKYFKNGTSIALMIDQRVSEGERVNFFGKGALTTTIPAQFVKKFKCKIVPVNIKREENNKFKCRIFEPVKFQEDENLKTITEHLNRIIENMILENPSQWIWTHNRWK
jgi:KDO2-lipid IV(A) lauroyltransferase